ncbi:MAG: 5-nucleotidase/2,3-cyclic phosphodiesterase-like hydrolase, partial [Chthonomonadales bacterium]|nr:5-nucleotidase/2,3-cyclic phosphodiesterase-like hydrolase [Chthonomonadales bacterium]
IGATRDQELASTVPGIDLIIGGHSHTVLEEGIQVENTLIVQAGSRGSHVGRIEIEKNKNAGNNKNLVQTPERSALILRSKLETL